MNSMNKSFKTLVSKMKAAEADNIKKPSRLNFQRVFFSI